MHMLKGALLGGLAVGFLISCSNWQTPSFEGLELSQSYSTGARVNGNDQNKASVRSDQGPDVSKDPHLWLEEIESKAALNWVRAQNKRSLDHIATLSGHSERVRAAEAILSSKDKLAVAVLRDGYAYDFWQDADNPRGVWRRMPVDEYAQGRGLYDRADRPWDVLLDIDKLAAQEKTNWIFKGAKCLQPAGVRCMITLSDGGTDASVEREFDISTKSFVQNGFLVPEAKSDIAWLSDDKLLLATDMGDNSLTISGYPRQVRLWQRGTDMMEAEIIYAVEKSDVAVQPFVFSDGDIKIAGVLRAKTFYDSELYVFQPNRSELVLRKLPLPEKIDLHGMSNGAFIIALQESWQYKGAHFPIGSIIALDVVSGAASLVFEAREGEASNGIHVTDHTVYIELLDQVKGVVLAASKSAESWQKQRVDLPSNGVLSIASADRSDGTLLAVYENPTTPEQLFIHRRPSYNEKSTEGENSSPHLIDQNPAFYETADVVTIHLKAISKDGTEIPYAVTARQSVLDAGPAPTIQYGYGGFQISILPTYNALAGKLWIEQGGVWVTTSIRGGGEFGPAWHQAALNDNRQLAYDDFFAISEDLIARAITTPSQLGISGRSNGGLLMGVAFTQRPDLYAAISCGVPLLDMLRYHKLLAGASWIGEYGNPDREQDREWLERFSPYHNIKPDTEYPEMLIYTSTLDDRVHPGHARKMAARLGAMGIPFLYYENMEGGHAAASNPEQFAQREAVQISYFAQKLGLMKNKNP